MTQLAEFIQALATDVQLQSAFQQNPAQAMMKYGVEAEAIGSVLAKDKQAVELLTGCTTSLKAFYHVDPEINAGFIH